MKTTKPPIAINVKGTIVHCTDYPSAVKLAQAYANIHICDVGIWLMPYTRYERLSCLVSPEKTC